MVRGAEPGDSMSNEEFNHGDTQSTTEIKRKSTRPTFDSRTQRKMSNEKLGL